MNAGAKFRQLRERKGMSVRELARRCGVSAVYVSDVERGNRLGSGLMDCFRRELDATDNDVDYAYYEHGRLAPDLMFEHEDHVRECLAILRRNLRS